MMKNEPDITEIITNEALADVGPEEGVRIEVETEGPAAEESPTGGIREPDMDTVRDKVHRDAPYRAEGFNVFDNRGQRVAMAGTDQNRKASGPLFALAIAASLNKMAGY